MVDTGSVCHIVVLDLFKSFKSSIPVFFCGQIPIFFASSPPKYQATKGGPHHASRISRQERVQRMGKAIAQALNF